VLAGIGLLRLTPKKLRAHDEEATAFANAASPRIAVAAIAVTVTAQQQRPETPSATGDVATGNFRLVPPGRIQQREERRAARW
jgi:hypothetical protein